MTARTLEASVADLALPGGSILKLEAISPTSGAAITGVTVSEVVIYGVGISADNLPDPGLPAWVPLGD